MYVTAEIFKENVYSKHPSHNSPVSWGCGICRLYIYRGVRPASTHVWGIRFNYIWLWVSSLVALGNAECQFIVLTPWSPLIRSGNGSYSPIYRSNRTVWPFNSETNFTTVKLLVLHYNTWNQLILCKQMSSDSFKKYCLQNRSLQIIFHIFA